jgi:hypothetical protein
MKRDCGTTKWPAVSKNEYCSTVSIVPVIYRYSYSKEGDKKTIEWKRIILSCGLDHAE